MIFSIYKKNQGKNTRLCTSFAVALILGIGCLQLYKKLEAYDVGLWVETMVPAGLFVLFGFLIYWLINKVNIADFLINAEGELKKVNWSSRAEIIASTIVVIVVVVFMAVLLWLTDLSFQTFFMWLLGY